MLESYIDPELEAELLADIVPVTRPSLKQAKPEQGQSARPRTTVPLKLVSSEPAEAEEVAAPVQSAQRVAGYLVEENGIFVESSNGDPAPVCAPMEVVATYAAADSRGWGKLVRVQSATGNWVSLRIDSSELQGSASKVLARLALISSGEISVAQKLKEAGSRAMAGHEVRLIDIEADSRRYGVFDDLHGCKNGAELADKVQAAAREAYGAAGRRFVEKVIDGMPTVEKILSMSEQLTSKWKAQLPADPDGQVMRVAQRFAVIALAGQLATAFGLTAWPAGAAEAAAEAAFLDWYDRTHSDKQDAASVALQRLQGYLSTSASSIQVIGAGGNAVADPDAWSDACRLYILPEVWSRIMAGLDEKAVGKALVDVGILQQGDGERLMRKAPRSIPGRPRLFTVNVERLVMKEEM